MKQITREQIDEAIALASNNIEDISVLLSDNISKYADCDNDTIKQHAVHLATLSTAIQISMSMTKEVLYNLLCEN